MHRNKQSSLFDDLAGAAEQRQRDGEAEGLGSFEIDDQLDFSGPLDGQIGGLLAFGNAAGVAHQTVSVAQAHSIAHQAAGCDEFANSAIKAVLVSRALLVKIKRDLENQMRGLPKNLGLVIGRAKMSRGCAKVRRDFASHVADGTEFKWSSKEVATQPA
jgi:hypothetical protein